MKNYLLKSLNLTLASNISRIKLNICSRSREYTSYYEMYIHTKVQYDNCLFRDEISSADNYYDSYQKLQYGCFIYIFIYFYFFRDVLFRVPNFFSYLIIFYSYHTNEFVLPKWSAIMVSGFPH